MKNLSITNNEIQLFTVQEAAKYLKVSGQTLRRWDEAGRLVPQRTQGNQRRYSLTQLKSFKSKAKSVKSQSTAVAFHQEVPVVDVPAEKTFLPEPVVVASIPTVESAIVVPDAPRVVPSFQLPMVEKELPFHKTYSAEEINKPFERAAIVNNSGTKIVENGGQRAESENEPATNSQQPTANFSFYPITKFKQQNAKPTEFLVDYTAANSAQQTTNSQRPRAGRSFQVAFFVVLGFLLIPSVLLVAGHTAIMGMFAQKSTTLASATTKNSAVLAAQSVSPDLLFSVNIPSLFAKGATFSDTVKMAKTLQVAGLSSLNGGVITNNADVNAGTGKLTASNVIYSITAGTGIGVTTGQTPTISNTGVLSLGGGTGALSLVAGSNVSINGLTISANIPAAANSFGNVVVKGQPTLTAGSAADNLTFVQGTGIILTTNAGGKSVTINADAAALSPWVSTGTNLYYNLGNVGIGTSSPPGLLTVSGGNSGGNAAFIVNQTGAADILSASSSGSTKLTLTNNGDLLPGSSGTQNIGSSSLYWNNLYVNNVISPTTGTSGYIQRNNGVISPTYISDDLAIGGTSTSSALFRVSGTTGNVTGGTYNGDTLSANAITFVGGESLTLTPSKNVSFADSFSTVGSNPLTLTTTGSTNVTLPTGGTLLTNTEAANQTITSTQNSGTLFSLNDGTNIAGNIVGQSITLSGSGVNNQTGIQFNLSGATGANINDLLGSNSTWYVTSTGAASFQSVTTSNFAAASITSNGRFLASDGSAPSPSYSFTNSKATGLYLASTDNLGFATNGVERMQLLQNGQLGIGTAIPTGFVSVNGGNYGGNAALTINQTGAATNDIFAASASGTTKFVIDNNGAITAGSYQGTPVAAIYGGTGQSSFAVGNLLYASTTTALSKLAIGSSNQVLTVSGGVPSWQTVGGGAGGLCADCVINDPTTSATNLIKAGNDVTTPLSLQANATQSADLLDIFASNGSTKYFAINANGFITNATYQGSTIAAAYGGTGINTFTTGDLLYATSSGLLGRLGIGSGNQVLSVQNGVPTWASVGGGGSGLCATCVITNPTVSSTNTIAATPSGVVGLTLRETLGGGADILDIQNAGGTTTYAKFDSAGNLTMNDTTFFANGTLYNINNSGSSYFDIAKSDQVQTGFVNGNIISTGSGTLTLGAGKTLTASNTLTLNGVDGKTLGINDSTTLNTNSIGFAGAESLTLAAAKNVSFADAFATSGSNPITLTSTGATNVTLPTTGTLLTNTASANQTITSTQTTGTLFGLADSTNLTGNVVGQSITLSGSGAFNQTGLQFNLSGATGASLNDIVGTGNTWSVSNTGIARFANELPTGTTGTFGWLQRNNGALAPTNITDDLLIGATASNSAFVALSGTAATTGTQAAILANSLTTGYGLGVQSTSTAFTTGSLGYFQWNPASATTATGNLLTLNVGANGTLGNILDVQNNGSTVFGVSQTQITANLPTQFTAPGDSSFAYDLNLTNPIASYIKSAAPLSLYAGDVSNSSYLTLGTYNTGRVVVDSQALLVNQAATISGQLVIGTNSPDSTGIGNFYLTNDSTYGKALAILNQKESQDIFSASASGTTQFTINNTGDISLAGSAVSSSNYITAPNFTVSTAGLLTATNIIDSGLAANSAVYTNGSSQLTTAAPTGGTIGFLQRNLGALSPTNITDDLLLGGTGTASAKFAFINNIGSGTPTASISAQTGNTGLSIDASGNIQTYDNQTLTLGGSKTGNISFSPNGSVAETILGNGNVGIGTTNPIGTFNVFSTSSQQSDDTYALSSTSTIAGVGAHTQGFTRSGFFTGDTIGGIQSIVLGKSSSSAIKLGGVGSSNSQLYFNSSLLSGTDIAVRGQNGAVIEDINANSLNSGILLRTVSGTGPIAFSLQNSEKARFDSSGNLGIGTTSPLATLDVRGNSATTPAASISANSNFAALLANNSGSGDIFTASASGATRFTISTNGNLAIAGSAVSSSNYITAPNFTVSTAGAIVGVGVNAGSGLLQGTGGLTLTGTTAINTTGTANTSIGNVAGTFALTSNGGLNVTTGGALTGVASLDTITTSATALTFAGAGSVAAGGTSNLALDAGTSGTVNIAGVSTGNVNIAGGSGSTGCTITNATGDLTCTGNITGAATGTNGYFQRNSGALAPTNITDDLLLGGTATSSAKFGFLNNAGGTPTASISANSGNNAVYITGDGSLATTNRQSLTIGNSSTYNTSGNVLINPNGTGNVGIGTTSPTQALQISGNTLTSGELRAGTTGAYASLSYNGASGSLSLAGGSSTWTFNGAGVTAGSYTSATSFTVSKSGAGTGVTGFVNDGTNWNYDLSTANGISFSPNNTLAVRIAPSGNVGIGTTAPTALLDVNGAASVSASLSFRTGAGAIQTTALNTLTLGGATTGNVVINSAGSVALTAQGANLIANGTLTGLTGLSSSGTITFSSLGLGIAHLSSGGVMSSAAVGLSSADVTGTLGVGNGGTGITSLALGSLVYGAGGTSAVNTLGIGSTGQVLTVSGGVPSWTTNPTPPSSGTFGYFQRNSGALAPTNITDDLLLGGTSTASAKFAFINDAAGTPTASISAQNAGGQALVLDAGGNIQTTNKGSLTLGGGQTGNIVIAGLATGVVHSTSGVLSSSVVTNAELQNSSITINNGTGITGGGSVSLGGSLTLTNSGVTSAVAGTGIGVSGATGAVTISNTGVTSVTGTANQVIASGATGGITLSLPQSINTGASPTFTGLNLSGLAINSAIYTDGSKNLTTTAPTSGTIGYFQRNSGALAPTNITDDLLLGGTATSSALVRLPGLTNQNAYFNLGTGNFGIGTTTPTLATLDVRGNSATTPAASISANSNFAAFLANNNGSGDIFTASSSSQTRFTIANNGDLTSTSSDTTGNALSVLANNITTGTAATISANALTTGNELSLYSQSNNITTGSLLNVNATGNSAFTNALASIAWSPNLATTATGDLLQLNVGPNGTLGNILNVENNGSSLFAVSQSQITTNLPAQFTAPGDTSFAYDLNLTNPILSSIKSISSINMYAGDVNNSSYLTLGTYNSGNVVIDSQALVTNQSASISGQLVVGTNLAPANISNFYLTNSATFGKALAILNQTESTDILSASSSGVTKFTVDSSGDLISAGVLQTNGSAVVAYNRIGTGTTANGLSSANDLYITGKLEVAGNVYAPLTGTSGYFQRNLGALSPTNITDDLLLGGTGTASAKFAFINNIGSGTPTASISAQTGNTGLSIDASGNIQTYDNQTLTLGGSKTGNISFSPNGSVAETILGNGNVGIGTTNPGAKLEIKGAGTSLGLQLKTTDSNGTQIFGTRDDGYISLSNGSLYTEVSGAGGSGTLYVTNTNGVGSRIATFRGQGNADRFQIYDDRVLSSVNVTIGASTVPTATLDVVGAASVSGSLSFRNGAASIVATQKNNLTLGDTNTGNVIINPSGNVGIGTTTPGTMLQVVNNQDAGTTINVTNTNNTTNARTLFTASTAGGGAYLEAIPSSSTVVPAWTNSAVLTTDLPTLNIGNYSASGIIKFHTGSTSNERMRIDTAGNVGIGTTAPTALLHVNGGTSGGNAAAIFNQTGASSNDILSASASGTTKFTINNGGDISLAGSAVSSSNYITAPNFSVTTAGNIIGAGVLQTNGTSVVAYNRIGTGTTANGLSSANDLYITGKLEVAGNVYAPLTGTNGYIQRNLGALAPSNITDDLLLGSTASTSAIVKLPGLTNNNAFFNLGTGNFGIGVNGNNQTLLATLDVRGNSATTPAASISANSNFAAFLANNNGSGDIFTASSSSQTRFTIANNGDLTSTSSDTTGNALSVLANNITTGTAATISANALTTGNELSIYSQGNNITTGSLFNLNATGNSAFTNALASMSWSPNLATTATGDLLQLNVGANGTLGNILNIQNNGSSVFSVSQTQITANLPTQFTAPGDAAFAYDLNLTNPTAAYIKSAAPLYITSGDINNSSDLNLSTYNKGSIFANTESFVVNGAASVSGQLTLGTLTQNPTQMGNFYLTNDQTYGKALAILNQTEGADIFAASTSGTTRFVIQSGGNVGIGTSLPAFALDLQNANSASVAASIYNTDTGANASGMIVKLGFTGTGTAVTNAITGNSFIKFLNGNGVAQGGIDSNAAGGVVYQTGGADYAEYYKVANGQGQLQPGTLVCLTTDGVGKCGGTNINILGIVSQAAGFVGNSSHAGDSNYVLVGTLGQINTAVNTDSGVIAQSDPLTLDANGNVTKATKAGTIVGYALGNYDPATDGQTQLLVSVNPTWYDPTVSIAMDGNITNGQAPTVNNNPVATVTGPTSNDSVLGASDSAQFTHDIATISAGLDNAQTNLQQNINQTNNLSLRVNSLEDLTNNLASVSALLNNPASSAAVMNIDNLDVTSATVSGQLQILGKTTVNDLGVTGNLTAGLVSVDGLTASIESIAQPLRLQPNAAAAIQLENKAVVIATNGDITTQGTVTAKKINIDATDVAAASVGTGTVLTASTSATITTTAVTNKSHIFITVRGSTPLPLSVISTTPGASFNVALPKAQTKDIKFDWWIVN